MFESTEELYKYLDTDELLGLDSEYSIFSKNLKNKFNAKGFHFNKWWVFTPTNWKCPACKRNKTELVKLNKHNDLSGQLHEHHDHMSDLAKKRFDDISSSRENIIADKLAEKFVVRLSYSMASYDSTIICSDCNEADRNAKVLVGTHDFFSFSPFEISQFILVENNMEHQIKTSIARDIWEEQSINFKLRLNLIDNIATIAAQNKHWYQPSRETALQTSRKAEHYLEIHGLRRLQKYDTEQLLYTPVVYQGKKDKWRYKPIKIVKRQPTSGEIQHLVNTKGKSWIKQKENWICPICNRSKYECVQPSKNNPWVFETKAKSFYNQNNNRWAETIVVCNECSRVVNLIQKEVDLKGALNHSGCCLIKVEELKRAIEKHNHHNTHTMDNEWINDILGNLRERLSQDLYSYSKNAPTQDEEKD